MIKLLGNNKYFRFIQLILFLTLILVLVSCNSKAIDNTEIVTEDVVEEVIMTDYDGNVYPTIMIGEQIWMAKNLRVTHYNDGSDINYFSANGDEGNDKEFGLLYDFVTVNKSDKNIAPDGWHVPTREEWEILIESLGGLSEAGKAMKELNYWVNNLNEAPSEFNARPAGMHDFTNIFQWFSTSACYSTSSNSSGSDALYYYMENGDQLLEGSFHPNDAVSVRLVKDRD